MIDFKDVKDPEFVDYKQHLEPGIHEVKITSIVFPDVEESKSPYLKFTWENKEGSVAEHNFYVSNRAREFSMAHIKHIALAVATKEIVNNISAKTFNEFAVKIFNIVGNKTYRQKFNGEEFQGKDDKIRMKSTIGFLSKTNPLAESLTTLKEDSKLKFNSNNPFDIKRLSSVISSVIENGHFDKSDSSLPF